MLRCLLVCVHYRQNARCHSFCRLAICHCRFSVVCDYYFRILRCRVICHVRIVSGCLCDLVQVCSRLVICDLVERSCLSCLHTHCYCLRQFVCIRCPCLVRRVLLQRERECLILEFGRYFVSCDALRYLQLCFRSEFTCISEITKIINNVRSSSLWLNYFATYIFYYKCNLSLSVVSR